MSGRNREQSVCHVTLWKAGNALKHEWGFSMLQMSKVQFGYFVINYVKVIICFACERDVVSYSEGEKIG